MLIIGSHISPLGDLKTPGGFSCLILLNAYVKSVAIAKAITNLVAKKSPNKKTLNISETKSPALNRLGKVFFRTEDAAKELG